MRAGLAKMRMFLGGVALITLAACAQGVPDSGAGVGFGDYNAYKRAQAERELALAGRALPPPQAVSTEPLGASGTGVITGANTGVASQYPAVPIPGQAGSLAGPFAGSVVNPGATPEDQAAEDIAAAATAALNSGTVPLQASPSNPPPPVVNAAGISQETNFEAVSAQRTIEDDAARRAALAAQYQVVQPTAVPTRAGGAVPNIVEYALSTTHAPGTKIYSRVGLNAAQRAARNCAKFASPDLAQQDFLARGGPQRDPQGLDPDGDGFACTWDPRPFQLARGG